MAHVWVKNLETGLSWEVDADRAKYLLGQRNADMEPTYEKTSAPKRPRKAAESPTDSGGDGGTGDGDTPPAS